MRRWNGWGDTTTLYHLHPTGALFLQEMLGARQTPRDITYAEAVAQVPAPRLPPHTLISDDPEIRLLHARGQSFPDWVALRTRQIAAFPDGVAFPTTEAEVRALLRYAQAVDVRIIPYGGGTSVVGHINPLADGVPTLTVDMSRMSRLNSISHECGLATFGAGVSGPNADVLRQVCKTFDPTGMMNPGKLVESAPVT
jgi:alkyldihydroxyacetonephosphate synthase